MLSAIGEPILDWLENEVIPEAYNRLDLFRFYVGRWRHMLNEHTYKGWPQ